MEAPQALQETKRALGAVLASIGMARDGGTTVIENDGT
jgi:hypothetical protein